MKAFLLAIATFCAVLLLGGWSVARGAEERPDFQIVGLDDRPNLKNSLRAAALESRRVIRENTTVEWPGTVLIVWASEDLFRNKTGFHPENSAAAASPSEMTIWINEPAWTRSSNLDRQQTMTHELGHILLGSLPGGRELPLWANEGIVMHLAGQWSYEEHMKLLSAHLFGQLPRLHDLETSFPRDGESQTLAYRMSYSAISVVASDYGDPPGRVGRLLRRLEQPEYGAYLARELWDPYRVEGWQLATERALGSKVSTGVIVLTGTGSIFLLISVLFVVAYATVRARRANRARAYEEEREPWEESLTEEDVQDIYGDREERWKE